MTAECPPARLGAAGEAFWCSTLEEFELNPAELQVLEAACRTVDELCVLTEALSGASATVLGSTGQPRAHPLFAEVRAHRKVLESLTSALGLPMPDEASGRPRTPAARRAARARWSKPGSRAGLRAVADGPA